jgi:hypothetical protein
VSLLHVEGAPEIRRVLAARLPGRPAPAIAAVTAAIASTAPTRPRRAAAADG